MNGIKYRSADEMKDSGIEWIGEIPRDWHVLMIKRLSTISRGASPRPIDDPRFFDDFGEYGWTRISDVTASSGFLDTTEQRMSKIGANLSVKLQPNSLFLSIAGSVGKPCINKIKVCIHDGFVYFPMLDDSLIKFMYYLFEGAQCYLGLGKLGTQLNLNRETVGSIHIPFTPQFCNQRKIANFLDIKIAQFDSIIAKKELLISKLEEAKKSLISEVVTGKVKIVDGQMIWRQPEEMKDSGFEWLGMIPKSWKVIKLKFIGESIIGLTYSPDDIVNVPGTLVLRSSNIQNGKLDFHDTVYVNKSISKDLSLRKGDILICSRNGSRDLIGKNAVIDSDAAGSTFGAFMTIYRTIYWKFIYYIFNSTLFEYQSSSFLSSTINQLTSGNLNNFVVAFPMSSDERNSISSFLDIERVKFDETVEYTKSQITLLKSAKQSLISEAVTGKIDLRDWEIIEQGGVS